MMIYKKTEKISVNPIAVAKYLNNQISKEKADKHTKWENAMRNLMDTLELFIKDLDRSKFETVNEKTLKSQAYKDWKPEQGYICLFNYVVNELPLEQREIIYPVLKVLLYCSVCLREATWGYKWNGEIGLKNGLPQVPNLIGLEFDKKVLPCKKCRNKMIEKKEIGVSLPLKVLSVYISPDTFGRDAREIDKDVKIENVHYTFKSWWQPDTDTPTIPNILSVKVTIPNSVVMVFYEKNADSSHREPIEHSSESSNIPEDLQAHENYKYNNINSLSQNSNPVKDFDLFYKEQSEYSSQSLKIPQKIKIRHNDYYSNFSTLPHKPSVPVKAQWEVIYPERHFSQPSYNRVVLKGLKNLGNTCYMNSVLQCLINLPQVANTLISYERNHPLRNALLSIIISQKQGQNLFRPLYDFKCQLDNYLPQFSSHNPNDVKYFFIQLMGVLQNCAKLFFIELSLVWKCVNKHNNILEDTIPFVNVNRLSIDKEKEIGNSLLNYFSSFNETLTCNKCQGKIKEMGDIRIKFPEILVVHLSEMRMRANQRVMYPENICVNQNAYKLKALVKTSEIHATALVEIEGTWYEFDDGLVRPCRGFLHDDAVLLFYSR